MRLKALGLAAVLAMAAGPVWAQSAPVEYDLSFDNAVHHEARITVTYRDIGSGPLRLRMSRSSPGQLATALAPQPSSPGSARLQRLGQREPGGAWEVGGASRLHVTAAAWHGPGTSQRPRIA